MAEIRLLSSDISFSGSCYAKAVYMGNITELTVLGKYPSAPPCRRINADSYVDLRDGVVYDYSHGTSKADSFQSVRRTLANIRALINTNIVDPRHCLWVTLTYAENMTDVKRLYQDFKKFWQRFCYWCRGQGYSKPEYITVIEPQGRGAWHCHSFFIWDSDAPFIDNNSVICELWGHGFTKTKAVKGSCDNIGAYFSAYLADMPLDEFEALPDASKELLRDSDTVLVKTFEDERETIKEKKFVKGGRLCLYPSGMNIIRSSRGIRRPDVEKTNYGKAREKASAGTLTFSRAYEVLGNDGVSINTIRKEFYNSKR